ncbi:MAG TPA: hypothetical protein VFZ47_00475 [Chitinophagaceae bacterium]
MSLALLKKMCIVILLASCASSSRNSTKDTSTNTVDNNSQDQPIIDSGRTPLSLMDLPTSQYGGFALAPGFYEAEFKTYCLQPGTPDPTPGDAYLQGPVTGHRREIIETALLNSTKYPNMEQRNIQLLLWSVVSNGNYNKLSPSVQADASRLLTPKQIFELKGGVMGVIKQVSNSGVLGANSNMQKLFEAGTTSYESYERLAVLNERSQVKRHGVKFDQWYKQKENYYIRYFPASYKKVKIQIFVPEGLLDAENKVNGDYLLFDPTATQANPAFTNAQRLGVGAPVKEIVRIIVQVSKNPRPQPKSPERKPRPSSPNPKS